MAQERLKISQLYPGHLESAFLLSTGAGWNQNRVDWMRVLTLAKDLSFGGWIGERLIVTGAVARYRQCGWVGMLLVAEGYRGQGHGRAMLEFLLEAAKERGLQWLGLDATEMGKPLYLSRGFQPIGTINRWQLARHHEPLRMPTIRKWGDGLEDDPGP